MEGGQRPDRRALALDGTAQLADVARGDRLGFDREDPLLALAGVLVVERDPPVDAPVGRAPTSPSAHRWN